MTRSQGIIAKLAVVAAALSVLGVAFAHIQPQTQSLEKEETGTSGGNSGGGNSGEGGRK